MITRQEGLASNAWRVISLIVEEAVNRRYKQSSGALP